MSCCGTLADALPQELTSFSGYDKLQWPSEASVANTINAPVNWAVCVCHCLPTAESMAYKSLTSFCVCHAGSLCRGSSASARGVLLLLSVRRPACPCCPSISQLCSSGLSGSRQSVAFGEDATGRAEGQLQGAAAAATQWCGGCLAGGLC